MIDVNFTTIHFSQDFIKIIKIDCVGVINFKALCRLTDSHQVQLVVHNSENLERI